MSHDWNSTQRLVEIDFSNFRRLLVTSVLLELSKAQYLKSLHVGLRTSVLLQRQFLHNMT